MKYATKKRFVIYNNFKFEFGVTVGTTRQITFEKEERGRRTEGNGKAAQNAAQSQKTWNRGSGGNAA